MSEYAIVRAIESQTKVLDKIADALRLIAGNLEPQTISQKQGAPKLFLGDVLGKTEGD